MKRTGSVFCALLLAAALAEGGGGPLNTLVIVNDLSPRSLELGKIYQSARQIPDQNIFHISTTTNYNLTTAAFSNELRNPILNYIASSGLSNQIDYLVFMHDMPYRVYLGGSSNGLTSAMYFNFRAAQPPEALGWTNDYFVQERAFSHSGLPSSNRYYASALITGFTFEKATNLIARAALADGTRPTGTVYLVHAVYEPRNIQWPQFENVAFINRFLDIPQSVALLDGRFVTNKTDVIGYMVGVQSVDELPSNTFIPGALGNHLTSYGGHLQDTVVGQMSDLHWINNGCVGSYGTVTEPYALTNKFPQARLHYWYGRGFNLAESYYMSVRNPHQGVLVGDPLCAPYAVKPSVFLDGVASNETVSGSVVLAVTGTAVSAAAPLNRIDLFLDGYYRATLTNVPPTASNVVTVTINSTNCTYRVPAGATLYTTATGLAASINASNIGFTATAYGDRVEVKQNALGVSGGWIGCSAGSSTGTASDVTIHARTPFTNFLETAQNAYEQVTLVGTPAVGDIIRVAVTNLAGTLYSNQVVAVSGDTAYTLLTNLEGVVNSDTNLQNALGCEVRWVGYNYDIDKFEAYLVARTNTWEGRNLHVKYSILKEPGSTLANDSFTDYFNDNSDVLSARATVFLSEGRTNLSAAYTLNTATLPDGPHELTAVAYEGTAVKTQGRVTIPFVVDNNSVECAITNPPTGGTALLSEPVTAHVQASSVTSVEFYVEGKKLAATNAAPYVFSFAATNYGVGTVNMQAKAFELGGNSVLSSNVTVSILPDYDFDALDDNWEVRNWGSITVTGGTNDWDDDLISNRDEYIADTQPTNNQSYFLVSWIGWTNSQAQIEYVSSTARQYRLHYTDGTLLDGLWLESSNWLWGGSGVTTQLDDGTLMPLPTNAMRFYRVRAHRP